MIQQVNLLIAEFTPTREVLDGRQTMLGILLLVGILGLVAANETWQLFGSKETAAVLQGELDALQSHVPVGDSIEALQASISNLTQEQADLRSEAEALLEAHRRSGFSEEIRVLAETRVAGLWLTGFAIFSSEAGPAIDLSGRAHDTRSVAHFVDELRDHGGLHGYTFAEIEIHEDEGFARFDLHGWRDSE